MGESVGRPRAQVAILTRHGLEVVPSGVCSVGRVWFSEGSVVRCIGWGLVGPPGAGCYVASVRTRARGTRECNSLGVLRLWVPQEFTVPGGHPLEDSGDYNFCCVRMSWDSDVCLYGELEGWVPREVTIWSFVGWRLRVVASWVVAVCAESSLLVRLRRLGSYLPQAYK